MHPLKFDRQGQSASRVRILLLDSWPDRAIRVVCIFPTLQPRAAKGKAVDKNWRTRVQKLRSSADMPETTPIKPETVAALGLQFVGISLTDEQTAAAAGVLNALAGDMQAFRKLALGDEEP